MTEIEERITNLLDFDWDFDADVINSLCDKKALSETKSVLEYHESLLHNATQSWNSFLENLSGEAIAAYCTKLAQRPLNAVDESKLMLVMQSALLQKQGLLDSVPEVLVVRGVMELLHSKNERIKVFYFSDTIKDGDIAKSKIRDHYEIINEKYGAHIQVVDYIGSTPGRSLQTGSQILDFLGSRAELESDYHLCKTHRSANIFVNNASRAKFAGKEKSQGSHCLWARVRDPKTNAVHNIIGVDNEAFMPFRNYIDDLFIVNGMPEHRKLSDLSKGTQFRSLKHFIIPQALCAMTKGGCPPGFAVTKVSVDDHIPSFEIRADEVVLVNPDHYLNGKSLSSHPDGILGISRHLGVALNSQVKAEFFHPDTNELIDTRELVITDHLGKHAGKDTLTNGSSRGLNGYILPEIGRSWNKASYDDYAYYIKEMPIGTRVKISKA